MQVNQEVKLFVPGRLCIFGEHSDWAGRYADMNAEVPPGLAIVTGIDLGIHAVAWESNHFSFSSMNENGEELNFSCDMDLKTLKAQAKENHFFCYACGVAAYMSEHYQVGGVSIQVSEVTLPIKKGLSSSAAVCVLVARAFNEIYQLKMSTSGEMQAAYRGELLTSSRCGRLDQACAYGVRTILMEFVGNDISTEKLKIGQNLYWVFADLNGEKDTKKILSDLNRAYPFAQTEQDKLIHSALGRDNHEIIHIASKLFAEGDAEKLGALMTKAQCLFDEKVAPACSELTAPKLHAMLEDEVIKTYVYGGKGVGSQGDGSIQFIAKNKQCQEKLVAYLNEALGLQAFPFTLRASDRVRKAIIPLAGFGTRMYPATRFVKKELLPIVDENGVVKPVLMYLLEELDSSGIEEIILVVGPDELVFFQQIFNTPLTDERVNKLPGRVREYEELILRLGRKIKYAVQETRRGFGHAVYQAARYLEKEPVLLLLGDFVYKSNLNKSCARQTIDAYRKSGGQPTIAIKEIPLEKVVHYGTLTGTFNGDGGILMNVSDMIEKPTMEYARDFLAVKKTNGEKGYYATFGQYVLTPEVFDFLREDIELHEANWDNSEIQLTSALQKVLDIKGMTGVLVDGVSFDVGIPEAYHKTAVSYGGR